MTDIIYKQYTKAIEKDVYHANLSNGSQRSLYPSDAELAAFAAATYSVDPQYITNDKKERIPASWEVLAVGSNKEDGYGATAYWHPERRQLVFAHQGTEFSSLKDWKTNLAGIVHDKVTGQHKSAEEFVTKVYETVVKSMGEPINVSATGHSLGGFLAQTTAYQAAEKKLHVHTVTFDSPDARGALLDATALYYKSADMFQLDILHYKSYPNRVNTCTSESTANDKKTLGRARRIYPEMPLWKDDSFKEAMNYTVQSHSMTGIYKQFDQATGQPIKTKSIVDWPIISFENKEVSTSTFGFVTAAIYDLVTCEDKRFKKLFEFAKRSNNYDPNPENMNLRQELDLNYDCHYRTTHIDNEIVKINALYFPALIEFLQKYQWYREIVENEPEVTSYLIQFASKISDNFYQELKNYHIHEDVNGTTISCSTGSVHEFIQKMHIIFQLNPDILNLFKKYEASLMARVPQVIKKLQAEHHDFAQNQAQFRTDHQNLAEEQAKLKEEIKNINTTSTQKNITPGFLVFRGNSIANNPKINNVNVNNNSNGGIVGENAKVDNLTIDKLNFEDIKKTEKNPKNDEEKEEDYEEIVKKHVL